MNMTLEMQQRLIAAGWTPPVNMQHPKYINMSWYKAQRMEFISRVIFENGVIYKQDIINRFGLSIPQAQSDIIEWQLINHPLMKCRRQKSYERNHYKFDESALQKRA